MSDQKLVLGARKVRSRFGIANPVLLQQLKQMGFEEGLAAASLEETNNKGISASLDWIDKNRDFWIENKDQYKKEVIPEQKEENIFVTNPFSGANEEKEIIEEDIVIPGKLKGFSEKEKMDFQQKLLEEKKKEIMKERKEKKRHLRELRKKMKREKRERLRKKKEEEERMLGISSQSSIIVEKKNIEESRRTSSTSTTNINTPSDVVIQIRLPEGRPIRYVGQSTDSLLSVYEFIVKNTKMEDNTFLLITNFPKREFEKEKCGKTSLSEADLAPRGVVQVLPLEKVGKLEKGNDPFPNNNNTNNMIHPPFGRGGGGIPPFGGGGMPPRDNEDDDDDDVDDNLKEKEDDDKEFNEFDVNGEFKTERRILQRQWFLNENETPKDDESGVEIYRITNETDHFVKNISFVVTGMFTMNEVENEVNTGKWILKRNKGKLLIIIKSKTTGNLTYEVVTLTSQILIIKKIG